MKKFWRKPDEMERSILFKAQRNSYLFLVAALLLWSFYESYRVYAYHDRLNLLPCLLLGTAALIQGISQAVLTRRAVKDDEDSSETGPLLKLIALICAVVSLLATAVAALVLMGVRT